MNLKDLTNQSQSTQNFVPIKEIKSGTVMLKDGSLRAILMVSSINFGLKSIDEKTAIITAFQDFLNSIDFSVQISIQSRRLNIAPYLQTLEKQMIGQTNELLRVQIKEYIEFIKFFTENHNVMTKSFFVVVPYDPPIIQGGGKSGWLNRLLKSKKSVSSAATNNQFEENLGQLNQRINVIKSGLGRIGLRSEILGTEELIELYFKLFNPGENEAPSIEDQNSNQTTR
ncbi:MAG: hypothetical protein COV08_03660 [Candidatus Vogelbacteria bacterium CG10_big_fil_rev_8_21_14_0_10_49_38]|uniref:TraC-like domain-containing protein n=1 Tax=Candidatus Vogelbacteria bacterium CG10_big_fil_rev_8_21_14_0_10_49_38 TaxID=1975043 RepID=A0A2H0RGQ4_9BACT|nr:MAG: hypothetical protein BK006_03650 [bacterium CG10_49_38]PIR45732.1 MAG: hypothetical protein COV08_03660 [Candidatus Vogelbacteria bacterium CG10_big_fil_rev_8_21_14_0_10_49_38]